MVTIDMLDMGLPQTNLLKKKQKTTTTTTTKTSVKHRKNEAQKKWDMHVDNSLLKSGNIMSNKEDTISSVRHIEWEIVTKPNFTWNAIL